MHPDVFKQCWELLKNSVLTDRKMVKTKKFYTRFKTKAISFITSLTANENLHC